MTRAACRAGAANLAMLFQPAADRRPGNFNPVPTEPALQLGGGHAVTVQLQEFAFVAIQLRGSVDRFADLFRLFLEPPGFGVNVEVGHGPKPILTTSIPGRSAVRTNWPCP